MAHQNEELYQELRASLQEAHLKGDKAAADQILERMNGLDRVLEAHPENWESLADATPERLAELGLETEHVEKHVPFSTEWDKDGKPTHTALEKPKSVRLSKGKHHVRTATENPSTKDKA